MRAGAIWGGLERSGVSWADLVRSGTIWRDLRRPGTILSDLERSGAIWCDLGRSGAIWDDLERYGARCHVKAICLNPREHHSPSPPVNTIVRTPRSENEKLKLFIEMERNGV